VAIPVVVLPLTVTDWPFDPLSVTLLPNMGYPEETGTVKAVPSCVPPQPARKATNTPAKPNTASCNRNCLKLILLN
jgi:hypothetical protein